ncbi:MAG: CPBP family intramembrane metalloprotease [Spiroplasmataceae bacterium]|jgi:membrane protease YdiL (CAAX protease family)|nr:CPBP family intramembrane metalloprotease [Spiroplasmataceae bacterium]
MSFQFDPQTYFQNNIWRIASFNGFFIFLLICWIVKKEWKRIHFSFTKEKLKIFWQSIYLLFSFSIIHFTLKFFFTDKADKIKDLIVAINNNKNNLWFLARIIFGLCVLAPLVEECVYRFFVFKIFGKNNPFSYFVSFFAFILAHYCWRGESITTLFLQYSVASFALIYIYKKSNWNILSPILLHSLINLLFISLTIINPNSFLI